MPGSITPPLSADLPGDPSDATALAESDARLPQRPSFDPVIQPWTVDTSNFAAVPAERLDLAQLRARFRTPPEWTPELSDEEWFRRVEQKPEFTQASVLIGLVKRESGLTVLLTRRTAHLRDHAGQISFPGGRSESFDADAIATAVRETAEEVGMEASFIEIIGSLPDFFTGTGFRVVPIVALITPGFTLQPDPFEVAEVFEVPLSFLLDPAHHRRHTVDLPEGRRRYYYSMPWHDYFIWGATAGMLRNLYHFLRA
jgi:8-oxo-dGTP pyrophosphatase MutT (NUDIX family)